MDPHACYQLAIAEIQKGQGLGSGYEWLAGLVSRVCMAGRVCMGGPNISGVQLSRDRLQEARSRSSIAASETELKTVKVLLIVLRNRGSYPCNVGRRDVLIWPSQHKREFNKATGNERMSM